MKKTLQNALKNPRKIKKLRWISLLRSSRTACPPLLQSWKRKRLPLKPRLTILIQLKTKRSSCPIQIYRDLSSSNSQTRSATTDTFWLTESFTRLSKFRQLSTTNFSTHKNLLLKKNYRKRVKLQKNPRRILRSIPRMSPSPIMRNKSQSLKILLRPCSGSMMTTRPTYKSRRRFGLPAAELGMQTCARPKGRSLKCPSRLTLWSKRSFRGRSSLSCLPNRAAG